MNTNRVWIEGAPKLSDRDLDANIHIFESNISDYTKTLAAGPDPWAEGCLREDQTVLEILKSEKERRVRE